MRQETFAKRGPSQLDLFGLHLREEQLTANNIELDSRKIAQSLYDEVTEVKSDLTDVKKDLREVLTLLKTKGLVVA